MRDKQLLLVLDNFEQIITAAQVVSDLLAACARAKILVTSRIPLHLRGEHEFPVPPLPAPDPKSALAMDSLSQFAAVELFIQRALAVKPDFVVNNDNAPAVTEICFRLDGLPLALELAAARLKLFSPQAMLGRLSSRLDLLRGGARDLPARHQALRQSIAWSYDLLAAEEQAFFRRLAVFVGGCSLEAVEAICRAAGDLAIDALDGLAALVDQSLLRQEQTKDGAPRFMMLETIREFALESLKSSADWERTRRAHADYFVALAEKAEPELTGPQQAVWLDTLEREHDNLRAVFHWVEETGEAEHGLRLGGAVWRFWIVRGYAREGRERLEALLAFPHAAQPTRLRARVLNAAGTIIHGIGDLVAARHLLEECLEIWRALEDKKGMATVINNLGWIAAHLGELATAQKLSEEGLTLHRELGEKRGMAVALNNLGWATFCRAEFFLAGSYQEQGLALRQEIGDERGIAYAKSMLAWTEEARGNYDKATALLEQAIQILRRLGDKQLLGLSLWVFGKIACDQADFRRAITLLEESIVLMEERGDAYGSAIAQCYLGAALQEQALDRTPTPTEESFKHAQELLEKSHANSRRVGSKWMMARALYFLGNDALRRKDDERAVAHYKESLRLGKELDDKHAVATTLLGFGRLALAKGNPDQAARLFAAAKSLHTAIGAPMTASEQKRFERDVSDMRALLGEEAFKSAWREGENATIDQVIE